MGTPLYRRNGATPERAKASPETRAVSLYWHIDQTCLPLSRHISEGGLVALAEVDALRQVPLVLLCAWCVLTNPARRLGR